MIKKTFLIAPILISAMGSGIFFISNNRISVDSEQTAPFVQAYAEGCLYELGWMQDFLVETTAYQQGTFPDLHSSLAQSEVESLIGRSLTSDESLAWGNIHDSDMSFSVDPAVIGDSVSSVSDEYKVIITMSGADPHGLTGFVKKNGDIDFETATHSPSPPIPPSN